MERKDVLLAAMAPCTVCFPPEKPFIHLASERDYTPPPPAPPSIGDQTAPGPCNQVAALASTKK